MPHPMYEKHQAVLQQAVAAIETRAYWSPYAESPRACSSIDSSNSKVCGVTVALKYTLVVWLSKVWSNGMSRRGTSDALACAHCGSGHADFEALQVHVFTACAAAAAAEGGAA